MESKIPVEAYHSEYERLTGVRIQLAGRESWWCLWQQRGLTLDDLRALVADKKRRIKAGELPVQSLAFRNLVANVDYAEEDIAFIRARTRTRQPDPGRAAVLRATGRPAASPPPDARSAGDILEAAKAFEAFRKLKEEL